LAGARQHKILEQSVGFSHDIPSAHSRYRALQEAVPTLKSTINLFEVSNFTSIHHGNSTLALEYISAKTSRPQKFQEIPRVSCEIVLKANHRVSCETVLKANFRHHAPAPLAQQLYHASSLQPLKDFESVKEINLLPRSKASPRAAAFLKHAPHSNSHTTLVHQPAHVSVVPDSCVTSSASGSSYLKETPSHPISESVIHTHVIQEAVEDAAGGKQQIPSQSQVSFVDIRFVFIIYSPHCYSCLYEQCAMYNLCFRLDKSVHHQNSLVSQTYLQTFSLLIKLH